MVTQKFFLKLIILINFFIYSQITYSSESSRYKILDRMMYTINPNAKIDGPIFYDLGARSEKSNYTSEVIKIILKNADNLSRKYFEAGDYQAYYAFLVLSLTVPLHEGFYLQFRSLKENICNENANSGDLVRKVSQSTFDIFNQYLKNKELVFLPNCSQIPEINEINQLIRGSDGTDLSMMQISIRWHFDDFLANKKYASVDQTIQYGLGLLLNGFNSVYRNALNYPCLYPSGEMSENEIDYLNLIKGVWAGKYNSGSIKQTCRFADKNSPYKKHDIVFAKNLEKIINFQKNIDSDFIGTLTPDSLVQKVILEIVKNLKNHLNEQHYLRLILNR